jgi:hypothetical protein
MENLPDIKEAIEGLYRAFSTYTLPTYTDPCLHCHTADDEAKLHSAPLRQLGVAELQDYAADALLDWGGVNDFKHFLPRIFELYVTLKDPGLELIDPEILFSKFRYGQWRMWPPHERDAVRTFLHALWAEVLSDPPEVGSYMDVESWLCTVAQAEDDLSPYFSQWIEDSRMSASFALSSLLLCGGVMGASSTVRNAFWENREEQYTQIRKWMMTPQVSQKLEQARVASDDPTSMDEFEAALGVIAANRF